MTISLLSKFFRGFYFTGIGADKENKSHNGPQQVEARIVGSKSETACKCNILCCAFCVFKALIANKNVLQSENFQY